MRALVRQATGFFEASDDAEPVLRRLEQNLMRDGGNLNQIAAEMSKANRRMKEPKFSKGERDHLFAQAEEIQSLRRTLRKMLARSDQMARQLEQAMVEREGERDGAL